LATVDVCAVLLVGRLLKTCIWWMASFLMWVWLLIRRNSLQIHNIRTSKQNWLPFSFGNN